MRGNAQRRRGLSARMRFPPSADELTALSASRQSSRRCVAGTAEIETTIMGKTFTLAALATLIALPLIAGPTGASASCQGRKDTGMVLGGVGGALLGNSISRGGGGAIVGGLGGAAVGPECAKQGCGGTPPPYYRR